MERCAAFPPQKRRRRICRELVRFQKMVSNREALAAKNIFKKKVHTGGRGVCFFGTVTKSP